MDDQFLWGDVTAVDGDGVTTRGAREYRGVPLVGPYGIYALPPLGERMVQLRSGGNSVGFGVAMTGEKAAPGEICLQSAGGACLYLKNDGTVLINGKVFPAEESEEA